MCTLSPNGYGARRSELNCAEEIVLAALEAAADDIYLKSVKLLLNGSPLQSLSSEDASRDFDYSNYFMFLKTTGCIKTGRLFSSLTPICLNLELPDCMLILPPIFIIIEFFAW